MQVVVRNTVGDPRQIGQTSHWGFSAFGDMRSETRVYEGSTGEIDPAQLRWVVYPNFQDFYTWVFPKIVVFPPKSSIKK